MRMTDGREPERGTDDKEEKRWLLRYGATIVVLAALWWTAYSCIQGAAAWVVYDALGLARKSHLGASLEFFLYDTVKILLLLIALIYVIS